MKNGQNYCIIQISSKFSSNIFFRLQYVIKMAGKNCHIIAISIYCNSSLLTIHLRNWNIWRKLDLRTRTWDFFTSTVLRGGLQTYFCEQIRDLWLGPQIWKSTICFGLRLNKFPVSHFPPGRKFPDTVLLTCQQPLSPTEIRRCTTIFHQLFDIVRIILIIESR